jgi:hypothetical protein
MINIIGIISSIISKGGMNGMIIAIDTIIPTTLVFSYPISDYNETEESEWSSFTTPGGRNVFPAFAGMKEHTISFKSVWDISNTNESFSLNRMFRGFYKGADEIILTIEKLSGLDYISMIKSICRTLKKPKNAFLETKMSAAGKILKVSQAESDPSPPLCVFVKNPTEIFLGYVTKANVTELNHDMLNIATRLSVEFEFMVAPDLIFQSARDLQDMILSGRSVGRL